MEENGTSQQEFLVPVFGTLTKTLIHVRIISEVGFTIMIKIPLIENFFPFLKKKRTVQLKSVRSVVTIGDFMV